MERRRFLRFLAAGGAIAVAPGLAACTYREYEGHGIWYRYPYGYYDYYYYPDVNVYFHLRSGYYYYPRNGVWIRSRDLPDRYHLNPAFRRRLVIRHPNPYERNGNHRREWERHRETEGKGTTRLRPPAQGRPAPARPETRSEPRRQSPAELPGARRERQTEPEQRRINREERRRIESESRQRRAREPGDWLSRGRLD